MSAVYSSALRKEIREPQRKIALLQKSVIRPYRIIRHDEAALHDIDEIGLRICFQNVKKIARFQSVIIFVTVPAHVVPVKLPIAVAVVFKSPAFQVYPLFHRGEVIYRAVFHTRPQFVLKAYPREVRELHVIVLQYLQRLLPEHHFLRQNHVGN